MLLMRRISSSRTATSMRADRAGRAEKVEEDDDDEDDAGADEGRNEEPEEDEGSDEEPEEDAVEWSSWAMLSCCIALYDEVEIEEDDDSEDDEGVGLCDSIASDVDDWNKRRPSLDGTQTATALPFLSSQSQFWPCLIAVVIKSARSGFATPQAGERYCHRHLGHEE